MTVPLLALGFGILLVWGAIRDVNPVELLQDVFSGEDVSGRRGSWRPKGVSVTGSASGARFASAAVPTNIGAVAWPTASRDVGPMFGETGPLWTTYHTGVDIDDVCGARIVSATAGIVRFAGANGPYGLQVRIAADRNTEIWYNHLSDIRVNVGQQVQIGTYIGPMGTTGSSTGCHLHFEIRVNGKPVDPMKYLSRSA